MSHPHSGPTSKRRSIQQAVLDRLQPSSLYLMAPGVRVAGKSCILSREVLYNILIEFGAPMKLTRLIKMCLSKTYSKVRIDKYLSESVPIQNGLGHNVVTVKKTEKL
jgi:hypothetical protein